MMHGECTHDKDTQVYKHKSLTHKALTFVPKQLSIPLECPSYPSHQLSILAALLYL